MADLPEEEQLGTPEWIVTFTDLMSLLLTFFILLLTFSTPRVEKLFELRGSILGSFGIISGERNEYDSETDPLPMLQGRDQRNPFAPASPPRFLPLRNRDPNLDLKRLRDQVGEEIQFERIEVGFRITIGDAIQFAPGETTMSGDSFIRLSKIAKPLEHYNYNLVVVGYVGGGEYDRIIANNDDPMDLAIRRAVGVAQRLVERHDIDPDIIGVAGYGPNGDDRPGGWVELILADRARFGSR